MNKIQGREQSPVLTLVSTLLSLGPLAVKAAPHLQPLWPISAGGVRGEQLACGDMAVAQPPLSLKSSCVPDPWVPRFLEPTSEDYQQVALWSCACIARLEGPRPSPGQIMKVQ